MKIKKTKNEEKKKQKEISEFKSILQLYWQEKKEIHKNIS